MRTACFWKHAALLAAAAATLAYARAAAAQSEAEKDAQKKIHELCVEKLGPDAEPIRAMVAGSKAILAGEVSSRAVAHLAKEVALSVPGIRDVDDQVSVARSLPLTGKVKDEASDVKLEITAKSRLVSQVGSSPAHAIEVEAVDGWVSLRGTLADQQHKDLALKAVQGISGVTKVIDLISVARS